MKVGDNEVMKELKLGIVLKRELKNVNVNAFARELGIAPSILHSWIGEKRYPNAKNFPLLKKVGDRLGLTLEQLLFDEAGPQQKCLARTTFTDNVATYEIAILKRIRGEE